MFSLNIQWSFKSYLHLILFDILKCMNKLENYEKSLHSKHLFIKIHYILLIILLKYWYPFVLKQVQFRKFINNIIFRSNCYDTKILIATQNSMLLSTSLCIYLLVTLIIQPIVVLFVKPDMSSRLTSQRVW